MNKAVQRYSGLAIGLHWWIAALIFIGFPLGVYMHDLPLSPYKLKLFSWHKWLGVSVFLLVLLRIFWRMSHTPPALPGKMPAWQTLASQGTHAALYVLMISVPLSGWLMSSAKGFPTVWLGLVPIPDLIGKDRELAKLLVIVHKTLNYSLLGLVVLHIAAVVKHQYIDKDGLLYRMLPFYRQKQFLHKEES